MRRNDIIKMLKEKYFNDVALLVERFGDVVFYFVYPTREEAIKTYKSLVENKIYNMNNKLEIVNLW